MIHQGPDTVASVYEAIDSISSTASDDGWVGERTTDRWAGGWVGGHPKQRLKRVASSDKCKSDRTPQDDVTLAYL